MSDVLQRIVASTRETLAKEDLDAATLRKSAEKRVADGPSHRFRSALTDGTKRVHLIAEIKAASPSAGPIVERPDVAGIAKQYERGGAVAMSIVTEPEFFRGSRDWIDVAKDASGLPVIMKDFIVEEAQIFRGVAAGADAVLLLASILDRRAIRGFLDVLGDLGRDALVEVHDERELDEALEGGARIVGVNNRNLRDFSVDLGTSESLGARIPRGIVRVAESGIRSRADVERLLAAGFYAFLVGESLLREADRTAAVRRLVGGES